VNGVNLAGEDTNISRGEEVLLRALTTPSRWIAPVVLPESVLPPHPTSESGLEARLGVDMTRPQGFDAERVRISDAAHARAQAALAAGLGRPERPQ